MRRRHHTVKPAHPHRHDEPSAPLKGASFWSLLAIFILGPCEPLIPLFVLPASRGDWAWAAATALAFGVATVVSMVGATLMMLAGANRLRLRGLERWAQAMAGGVLVASGLAVLFLGL